MRRVFISYHHENDQFYKEELIRVNGLHPIFIDASVDTGDISDELSDQSIRQKIRDEYLKDTTVTIILVGTETKNRKHVDWETYSSMYDGTKNKKSGILVVNLPDIENQYFTAPRVSEQQKIYPHNTTWQTITSRAEYERRYPYMPDRIIDNLLEPKALISVVNWSVIVSDWNSLQFLVDVASDDRASCEYNLSRTMRRANS